MKTNSNFFIAFAIIALLAATACKKTTTNTNNNTQPSGSTSHLKTLIQATNAGSNTDTITTNFSYDSQYRLTMQIAITKVAGVTIGADTTTYTYSTNTIVVNNSITGAVTYSLNTQGFRTSDNLGDTWAYNAAGYQTGSTQAATGTSITYSYNAQNQLDSQKAVSASGTNIYTYTYSSGYSAGAGSSWQTGQGAGYFLSGEVENKNGTITTITFTNTFFEVSTNVYRLTTQQTTTQGSSTQTISTFIYY